MAGSVTIRSCRADTKQLLALHAMDPARFPHLLASRGSGGRFDILFAHPEPPRRLEAGASAAQMEAFFADIDARADACDTECGELPFTRGDFVYFGYELAGLFESRLVLQAPALPLAFAQYCHASLVYDHLRGCAFVCASDKTDADALVAEAETVAPYQARRFALADISEEDPAHYRDAMARVHEYIRAGDVFQVNLSRAYTAHAPANVTPADMMAALIAVNPAPFAASATLGDAAILSASPECLLTIRGRSIQTAPIAGTAPRLTGSDDTVVCARLKAHPKERAEHIMLVDLERNDLGRICVPGSVRVPSLMRTETYATVHHLVSTVEGTLASGTSFSTILRGLFPGGSITGCPKIRCMEILAELETGPRAAYTGSLGYISRSGDAQLNILIRSAEFAHGAVSWRVGGGIVADSDPERELAETRAKAAGLLRAFGI